MQPTPMNHDPRRTQPRMPAMDASMNGMPNAGYPHAPYPTGGYSPVGQEGMQQGYQPMGYPQDYAQQPYPPMEQPYAPMQDWQQPVPPQGWTGPQQPMYQTGPMMPPPDPFGETVSVDPSLMNDRSRNLYERKDPFWDAPDQVHRKKRAEDKQVEKRAGHHAGSHAGQRLLVTLLVVAAICGVLYGTVFRIRTINVEGNVNIPDAEIIRIAGLRQGDSIFALDSKAMERAVNSNHYLIFSDVTRQWPSSVTVTVKERTPAAVMNYCGINYILDNKGMVLSETEDATLTLGLPEISGMDLVGAYGATVGHKLNVNAPLQMATMSSILMELRVMGAESIVKRVMMSNLSQLLLITNDDFSVNLGDYTRIHEKLKSMLFIRQYLLSNNNRAGTIDVSDPEKPTFIPE